LLGYALAQKTSDKLGLGALPALSHEYLILKLSNFHNVINEISSPIHLEDNTDRISTKRMATMARQCDSATEQGFLCSLTAICNFECQQKA